jgi:putative membrane-bound dehydrogenase-like protein
MKFSALFAASIILGAAVSALAEGRQLTGQWAPASTPALAPAEAQKRFKLPPGFEARLFAAEPDVINPVAMTWDDRGRLWVLELYEYPLGAPKGAKGRDRIKILEDTDGDGKADKVTVFADGFNLATGLQLGNGGVYVGQAPDLFFLRDTNGDDIADTRTKLLTGFGLDDRHELLNSFTWGPDGQLYMTHGVFTQSTVTDPANPGGPTVRMNAAVGRFNPRTKRLEVYADGTSNPWGVDFDRAGNAFVSACVIDHLFHMAAGGVYVRQGGVPGNSHTYQLLPSIVHHNHFMAAYGGVQVYQGNQFPAEYLGTIFMGNIHASAVHQDRLTPRGSSFEATPIQDFVTTDDGWFRPLSEQVGPDGALWIMDWYDKYPCYQNAQADPEGVDRERGRVWRIVYTGDKPGAPVPSRPPGMNLGKLTTAELAGLLADPNVWQRRMAQRLLNERRDPAARTTLENLARDGKSLEARLAGLWTLHGSGQLSEGILDSLKTDAEPAIRAWVARLSGERGDVSPGVMARLEKLATDSDPSVRLGVATALRQFASGSLTVDTPVSPALEKANIVPALGSLVAGAGTSDDPLLPFMIWMAAEPVVARDPGPLLAWLKSGGGAALPASGDLARRVARRICDTQKPEMLDQALAFIDALAPAEARLAESALQGLIDGLKEKALLPGAATGPFLARLDASGDPRVKELAQQLGSLWGDAAEAEKLLREIRDAGEPLQRRIESIRSARRLKKDATREALLGLLGADSPEALAVEALAALGEIGGDNRVAAEIVRRYPLLAAGARREAMEILASRNGWIRIFLGAVEDKTIAAAEVPAPVIRELSMSKDQQIRERARKAIGRYRKPNADKVKLIAQKKKVILSGPIDMEAGHEIAKRTCFICHKLYGEGAEVGPDLTGVGRSTLDALLANVIDPNQVIGKGYENVEVETKDGRSVNGRLVEDSDTHIKLISAGPKEDVVAKSDISTMRVTEMSVMPEGLEQMPDSDFRNLIWFILNPPRDGRTMTPELYKQLTGEEKPTASATKADGESLALWSPGWTIDCPEHGDAPAKLVEYAGRPNVLVTFPIDRSHGASIGRQTALPAGRKSELRVAVAADPRGDWQLRFLADGQVLQRTTIDAREPRWKQVAVDLSAFAGRKVDLRLENCANDLQWDYAYWGDLRLETAEN